MQFATLDYIVLLGYIIIIVGIGLFVSRRDKKRERNASDYFLANKGLVWWVNRCIIDCFKHFCRTVYRDGQAQVLRLDWGLHLMNGCQL